MIAEVEKSFTQKATFFVPSHTKKIFVVGFFDNIFNFVQGLA